MNVFAAMAGCMVLASCAAPPVTLYTLQAPAPRGAEVPLGPHPVVIAVARVSLPDDLDTEDILVRQGSVLASSHTGRWASRLSLAVTDLLTGRLAASRPDALVTDQPETTSPTYRLLVNISRLDLAVDAGGAGGTAILEADWMTVALNPTIPVRRDRTRIVLDGPVGDDREVVALTTAVVEKLARAIDSSALR